MRMFTSVHIVQIFPVITVFHIAYGVLEGFPGGAVIKNLPAKQEMQVQSIPRSGRSPGEGNGNPLQYSCLGNPMDRGATYSP